MLIASTPNGILSQPRPGLQGVCPHCQRAVIPKCGRIISWHWAHRNDSDSDCAGECETEWHLAWKRKFPEQWVEQPINGKRADVVVPNGPVIEFQHSAISADEIIQRERAHRSRLMWVVDASGFEDRIRITTEAEVVSIEWQQPRRCWENARCILLHFQDGLSLLHVEQWTDRYVGDTRNGHNVWTWEGHGYWWGIDEFLDQMLTRGKS